MSDYKRRTVAVRTLMANMWFHGDAVSSVASVMHDLGITPGDCDEAIALHTEVKGANPEVLRYMKAIRDRIREARVRAEKQWLKSRLPQEQAKGETP